MKKQPGWLDVCSARLKLSPHPSWMIDWGVVPFCAVDQARADQCRLGKASRGGTQNRQTIRAAKSTFEQYFIGKRSRTLFLTWHNVSTHSHSLHPNEQCGLLCCTELYAEEHLLPISLFRSVVLNHSRPVTPSTTTYYSSTAQQSRTNDIHACNHTEARLLPARIKRMKTINTSSRWKETHHTWVSFLSFQSLKRTTVIIAVIFGCV